MIVPVNPASNNPEHQVTYWDHIKEKALGWGADLVGFAEIEPLRALQTEPADLLNTFSRAISMAVEMPSAVFESISDRPTPIYSAVYQTANRILDGVAFRTARELQKEG